MRIPDNLTTSASEAAVPMPSIGRHDVEQLTSAPLLTPVQLVNELKLTTVLAIAAHPDDLDFGAAATIAGLTSAGVTVVYAVLTGGDAGGFDPAQRDSMVSIRQEEQRRAAHQVGVERVEIFDFKDGDLQATHVVMREIVRLMREVRPELVLTSHPERDWSRLQLSHPDHLACGEAVVQASYPAVENPFAYPELAEAGLEAFKLRWLLLMGGPASRTNVTVDVTGTAQRKISALNEHASQHPDPAGMRRFVLKAMEAQHPDDGRFGEAFHLVEVNAADTISGF
ncbi:MAG: PIG-L deacetylase family protein [Micrococcaceae bacterium]